MAKKKKEELLNTLCYTHLTLENTVELNNILKNNRLINDILLTIKTEQNANIVFNKFSSRICTCCNSLHRST